MRTHNTHGDVAQSVEQGTHKPGDFWMTKNEYVRFCRKHGILRLLNEERDKEIAFGDTGIGAKNAEIFHKHCNANKPYRLK